MATFRMVCWGGLIMWRSKPALTGANTWLANMVAIANRRGYTLPLKTYVTR